jgi:hypothetical protein
MGGGSCGAVSHNVFYVKIGFSCCFFLPEKDRLGRISNVRQRKA